MSILNEMSEALHKAGRTDLIGFGEKCLIRPRQAPPPPWKKTEKSEKAPDARDDRKPSNARGRKKEGWAKAKKPPSGAAGKPKKR